MSESQENESSSDETIIISNQKKSKQVVSNDIRKLVIEALNNGKLALNCSKIFKVNYAYVRKIYSIYRKTGRIEKLPNTHRLQLMTDQQKKSCAIGLMIIAK